MLLLQKELERVTAGFAKERQQLQTRIAAEENAKRSLKVLCVHVVTTGICVYQSMPSLNAFYAGLYLIIRMDCTGQYYATPSAE